MCMHIDAEWAWLPGWGARADRTPASAPTGCTVTLGPGPGGQDSLGVLADALARSEETFELASRHLDPSLVDVLGILASTSTTPTPGAPTSTTLTVAPTWTFTPAKASPVSATTIRTCARARGNARSRAPRWGSAALFDLGGHARESLCERLPTGLDAVFFASTGAEAVDSAMKFARAATRRPRLISCDSSFHGVTLGPLSLVGDDFFRRVRAVAAGCARVPFGDLDRLEAELRRGDVAAFIVEPIQGRMVTVAPPGYLQAAQELCRRHGTLFVLDEIQTGLGRTGRWFALEHWGLEPDFVLVGKALSGGYMPVAAMATRREIYSGPSARSSAHTCISRRTAKPAVDGGGLATLRVIERDDLVGRSERVGALLREGLGGAPGPPPADRRDPRPRHDDRDRAGGPLGPRRAPELAPDPHGERGSLPQLVVIPLHRDHAIITMASGMNDVVKLLPPLTLSEADAQSFLAALDSVLSDCEGEGGKNWAVVRDIAVATMRRRSRREHVAAPPRRSPSQLLAQGR